MTQQCSKYSISRFMGITSSDILGHLLNNVGEGHNTIRSDIVIVTNYVRLNFISIHSGCFAALGSIQDRERPCTYTKYLCVS